MQSLNAAVLLIIDVQQAIDDPTWGVRNNPNAEANMQHLLEVWRQRHLPIVHVRHSSRDGVIVPCVASRSRSTTTNRSPAIRPPVSW